MWRRARARQNRALSTSLSIDCVSLPQSQKRPLFHIQSLRTQTKRKHTNMRPTPPLQSATERSSMTWKQWVLLPLLTALIGYLGVFDVVMGPDRVVQPAFDAVLVRRIGSYSQIPSAFGIVATAMKGQQQEKTMPGTGLGVGIYYDKPSDTARWAVGFVCAERKACQKAYDELKAMESEKDNAMFVKMPQSESWRTVMPWRHFLSPMINAKRAWGSMFDAVAAETGKEADSLGPAVEIYNEKAASEVFLLYTENNDKLQ